MTLAELVDTLIENGMSLEICVDARVAKLYFSTRDESGNRLALARSIHREYLDPFEDQQFKESILEREVERCIASFKRGSK